jgi:diadenylate cyclase
MFFTYAKQNGGYLMDRILAFLKTYFDWFYITVPGVTDIIEILILSYVIYKIMLWFKSSRAWTLLKGIVVILVCMAIAYVLQFNTILYILENAFSVGILAVIILFQPELRRGLETLGRKKFVNYLIRDEEEDGSISDKTIYELVKTVTELSANRTGALIVLEDKVALGEYIDTGIAIDAVVTKELMLNIFEHNTPLHDGAVIISKNRVVAATCYLPLSGNAFINKELGTRHRAGIGISEVSDSLTLIVSEETGGISIARGGEVYRNLDAESVRNQLEAFKSEDVRRKDDKNTPIAKKRKASRSERRSGANEK